MYDAVSLLSFQIWYAMCVSEENIIVSIFFIQGLL